jgi:hypothetical protein
MNSARMSFGKKCFHIFSFRLMLAMAGFLLITAGAFGQTTTIVILSKSEQQTLRRLLEKDLIVKKLNDSIQQLAKAALQRTPRPLEVVHYEGLLNNNPVRIDTRKSLEDVDALVNLIYGSYGGSDAGYKVKATGFVKAWASTYKPTGNPINENKFTAFFWAYFLFRDCFDGPDRQRIEEWMREIATLEMNRNHTPNNNWQAKRLKIIGLIGYILGDVSFQQFALRGCMEYINSAYFADGTSEDLAKRDALSYHIGGIKPCLSVFINFKQFDPAFDLYEYVGADGGSIRKSIEYLIPYATGEKQHAEWVNTTVQLDKDRAAAGLDHYQPGKLFDPEDAKPLLEWACYYNPDWYGILDKEGLHTTTWVGLLNSPEVRKPL